MLDLTKQTQQVVSTPTHYPAESIESATGASLFAWWQAIVPVIIAYLVYRGIKIKAEVNRQNKILNDSPDPNEIGDLTMMKHLRKMVSEDIKTKEDEN